VSPSRVQYARTLQRASLTGFEDTPDLSRKRIRRPVREIAVWFWVRIGAVLVEVEGLRG